MDANLMDANFSMCACMGKTGNDPYCRCEMRFRGLTPTPVPPDVGSLTHAAETIMRKRRERADD